MLVQTQPCCSIKDTMNKDKICDLSKELVTILKSNSVWIEDSSYRDEYTLTCSKELGRAFDILASLEEELSK